MSISSLMDVNLYSTVDFNISEIITMLGNLSIYMYQFDTFVSENNLILINNGEGIMGVEVLPNVDDTKAQLLANKAD